MNTFVREDRRDGPDSIVEATMKARLVIARINRV